MTRPDTIFRALDDSGSEPFDWSAVTPRPAPRREWTLAAVIALAGFIGACGVVSGIFMERNFAEMREGK